MVWLIHITKKKAYSQISSCSLVKIEDQSRNKLVQDFIIIIIIIFYSVANLIFRLNCTLHPLSLELFLN